MTTRFHPCLARSVLAASVAGIGTGALPAWAEDANEEVRRLTTADSEVELGAG